MQAALNTDGMSTRDVTSQGSLVQQNENKQTTAQHEADNTNVNSDSIALSGRPVLVGLRRQPTIYPHGLDISVQTIHVVSNDSESYKSYRNYSRASTLRSESWNGQHKQQNLQNSLSVKQNCHRKYRISMIGGNPESLAALQVRRYKYPLTGNYYLDPQDQMAKMPWIYKYYECAKHYCRWKYLRWPLIFLASVLLFFGLITYCIWLHDVSITRQRYLQQRRFQNGSEAADEFKEISEETETTIGTMNVLPVTKITTTTEPNHLMQESTLLRAIDTGTHARQRPKEQTLTTKDYDASKGAIQWEKENVSHLKKTMLPIDEEFIGSEYSDEVAGGNYGVPAQRTRFTSGHQNSFGIPMEEDERILRILNGLSANAPPSTSLTPRTKVSPTIPPVKQLTPTSSMNESSDQKFSSQDSGCYSTSLQICQGVLEYDLTYNSTTQLSKLEQAAFENLIYSNCSERAVEFVCALLEPECRPSHIGLLPPCRRICKSILEACSIEIVNSDILSNAFDCGIYPDSNDPHKCEDPTRRHNFCYDNEFECYDNTCIPYQWQCDNIKDCAAGEDEEDCLQCDHQDEFRCRSNDKCVSESVRCDSKFDCFDGSDEDDCEEYGSGDESAAAFDEAAVNSFPRVFSYASYLSPNETNEKGLYSYITATNDDETGMKFEVHEVTNRTSGVSKEDVTNNVPESVKKGFVNFRDSKEIMMTSDSENKFKYSAVRGNRNSSRYSTPATSPLTTATTTTLKPAASQLILRTTGKPIEKVSTTCAPHQLRCISGKCITVTQLCDKKIDCPDGADEMMCVYKAERSTTKRYSSGQLGKNGVTVTTDSTRNDRRTIRTTTLKRRLKV